MILSICDSADVLSALRIVKILIQMIRIIIPILLMVSLMLDFAGAVASSDSDELNKALKSTIPKAIATLVILLFPQFVNITIHLVSNDDSYKNCLSNATVERISQIYAEEAEVYMKEAEKNMSRPALNLAKRAIRKIVDPELRKSYDERIEVVEKVIIAKEWIEKVRRTRSQEDYDKAVEAIAAVPDEEKRKELEKILEQIALSMPQSIEEYSSPGYIVNPLGVPYYNQCDKRWGDTKYDVGGGRNGGPATLCSSSCGYTSLAMAVAGVSRDYSVVPLTMVELFRAPLPSHRGYGAAEHSELRNKTKLAKYNVYPEAISTSHSSIMNALNAGKPVVILRKGHYLCLVGDGNGKVIVLDPFWTKYNGTYSIDNIERAIGGYNILQATAYSRIQ